MATGLDYKITFEGKQVIDWIKKNEKNLHGSIQNAVDVTTMYGLKEIKSGDVPKITGHLRRSYIQRKLYPLTRIITSNIVYASAVEFGRRAITIFPKRAKLLRFKVGGEFVFAKKVNQPARKGQYNLRDKTFPKVLKFFNKAMDKVLERAVR